MISQEPTIDPETTPAERRTIYLRLPSGWARAAVGAIEAAVIAWALPMVLTIVTYLGVSSNPWMSSIQWRDVTGIGGDIWAASLGASITLEEFSIRIIPLLLTLFIIVVGRAFLAGLAKYSSAALLFFPLPFVVVASALTGATAGHVRWFSVIPGALIISLIVVVWAFLRHEDCQRLTAPWPRWGRAAVRWSLQAVGLALVLSVVVLVVSIGFGHERAGGLMELLVLDGSIDVMASIFAQILLLPVALLWALSWIAGPGFAIGIDAWHSPVSAPTAPIPLLPMFGFLPEASVSYWVILAPIAVGFAWALWCRRRVRAHSAGDIAIAVGIAAFVSWLIFLALFAASTMSLGSARLALMGPSAPLSATFIVLEFFLPLALVLLLGSNEVRARLGVGSAVAAPTAVVLDEEAPVAEIKDSVTDLDNSPEAESESQE